MRYESSVPEKFLLAGLFALVASLFLGVMAVFAWGCWMLYRTGVVYYHLTGGLNGSGSIILAAIFPLTLVTTFVVTIYRNRPNWTGISMVLLLCLPAVLHERSFTETGQFERFMCDHRFLIVWLSLISMSALLWWRGKPPVLVRGGEL